jgi:predicted MFS family arabinose efflux permease
MICHSPDAAARGVAPPAAGSGVPGWLVTLLAVAGGLTAANLYYAQPLLSSLRAVFHVSTAAAGGLITITQAGYVLGMLFLVPLGDRVEKRGLVTILLAVTTAAMAAAGAAVSFPMLLIASLVSGVTSVVAQILVPFAASLAPEHARGRVVGRVMSGLLAGILLSRTLSSIVSGAAGWRVVYLGSAVLMALLAVALRLAAPPPGWCAPTGRWCAGDCTRRRCSARSAPSGPPSPSCSPARDSATRRSGWGSSRWSARRARA